MFGHKLQKDLFGLGNYLFDFSARLLHFPKIASLPGSALPLKQLLLFGADSSVTNGRQVGQLMVADRRVHLTQRSRGIGSNVYLRKKQNKTFNSEKLHGLVNLFRNYTFVLLGLQVSTFVDTC
jgi:hypothetical protein